MSVNDDLLPEYADNAGPGGDEDFSDLRVNFSEEEASSEARDRVVLPSGWYNVAITDGEIRKCGPNSKNPGKPYWGLEFTVQDGKYEDKKVWSNVMLFEGALYSLSQLLKSVGKADAIKSGRVPSLDELMGQTLQVRVSVQAANEEKGWDRRNDVKGYRPAETGGTVGTGSSLLP